MLDPVDHCISWQLFQLMDLESKTRSMALRLVIYNCFCHDYFHQGSFSREAFLAFIVIQEIVDTVKQSTGLFLKEDGEEGWIVVDDEAAGKKVGAVFRTMRAHEANLDATH